MTKKVLDKLFKDPGTGLIKTLRIWLLETDSWDSKTSNEIVNFLCRLEEVEK